MKERFRILLRLPFLLTLTLLIINDQWLKAAYPNWLTGKLSDFAGLFVFVVFLFVVLGQRVKTSRESQVLHFLVAAMFVAWKLAPVEILIGWLSGVTGLLMPSRVKDPTDLVALVTLLLSYKWLSLSTVTNPIRIHPQFFRKTLMVMVLLVTGWSLIATSYRWIPHKISPETGVLSRLQIAEVLEVVEKTMNENGFPVHRRETTDSGSYRFFFSWTIDATVVGKGKGGSFFLIPAPGVPSHPRFEGTLELSQDTSVGTWNVDAVLRAHGVQYDETKLTEAIRELLYVHLREKLNE
ncbi:MAG: hypothetical protein PHN52_13675 [candidate division Zixibacteria bacterium]|nr:hypothetical protein [candidate division Zixibacteria bacterium]